MMFVPSLATLMLCASAVTATILENGRPRITDFPDTKVNLADGQYETYNADAEEISYKGRWDSKMISWWAGPGIKFGFTGQSVAVTFGNETINSTLVAYRIAGLDWMHTNVTADATHLFVSPETPGVELTGPISPVTFEMRVTNWAYGVQIDKVHVAAGEKLVKIPDYPRRVEFIGDSLSAGMYNTYEALAGFAYGVGAGLGNTEYSITAYPGIYNPEPWDFSRNPAADLVVINLGTNDANAANNVTKSTYVESYKKLIQGVHGKWPEAQVIIMQMWQGFFQDGNTYGQNTDLRDEVYSVYEYFNTEEYLSDPITWDAITNTTSTTGKPAKPFAHFFNTTGILQHNDIAPQWHPTDVGQIKVASHLIQYITLKLGWPLYATGPEVYHETLYWNDQSSY
ncbi:Cellulase/esterase CelE [Colletotrichum fructicola]|nr:Cellulase/esterase CelE [Colletotrichum fructicola]